MSGNHRDQRAVRRTGLAPRRLSRRPVLATAGAARFASRLLARHAMAERGGAGTVREFLRQRMPVFAAAQHHWHAGGSPRVALTLSWQTGRGATVAPRSPMAASSLPGRGQRAPSVIPTRERFVRVDVLRAVPPVRPTTILADTTPALRPDAVRPTQPAAVADAPPKFALPRVLRRPAVAGAMAPAKPTAPEPTPADFGGTPAAFSQAGRQGLSTPALMAAIDVDGLADRVIRVIDRRLVATRERHGRI